MSSRSWLAAAWAAFEGADRDPRVFAALVDRLYEAPPVQRLPPLIFLALMCVWFGAELHWGVSAAIVGLYGFGAAWAAQMRAWRRSGAWPHGTALGWARAHAAVSFVKACGWGLAGYAWFDPASTSDQLLLAVVIAGTAGGSVGARASYLPSCAVHVTVAATPFMTALALVHPAIALPAGALGAAWLAQAALRARKQAREAVGLLLRNQELVERLKSAQEAEAQARAQAEERRAEAEMAMRAKSEFLAIVSHELRTPLNGILGMTAILQATDLTHAQGKAVQTVRDAGESLCLIVDDLLDVARMDAGCLKLNQQPFDLPRLCDGVVQILRVRAWEKGLTLNVALAADAPQMLVGDPGRLRQILINLVGNAVKFTERGSVTLRLGLTPGRPDCYRIEVEDTGIGIPESALPALFEPFTQVDARLSRGHGGVGLGLSIVKRLTGLMGGVAGVESRLGEGSRFWIDLPLVAPEAAAPAAGQSELAQASAPPEGIEPPLRILVVDDSAQMRLTLTAILTAFGHQVVEASSGLDGLAALRTGGVDLVVLDLDMPGLDGAATARLMRALPDVGEVPILAVSGYDLAHVNGRGLGFSADGVLKKPVTPDVLADAVSKVRLRCPKAA